MLHNPPLPMRWSLYPLRRDPDLALRGKYGMVRAAAALRPVWVSCVNGARATIGTLHMLVNWVQVCCWSYRIKLHVVYFVIVNDFIYILLDCETVAQCILLILNIHLP